MLNRFVEEIFAMRTTLWWLFLLRVWGLLFAIAAGTQLAWSADQPQPVGCQSSEHRQWDFWIGDWDVFDFDSQTSAPVARIHVDRILDGCVLREDYQDTKGHKGNP